MSQSKLPPCAVCGETNFIKQSGFFVCTNCDVQSQELIDEAFDYIGDNADRLLADDDREEITVVAEREEEERNLTSWEAYNLILKGILQEIIQLGAPEEVRIVAFQLWAQYLRKCGAAFTSKNVKKPPKLTAGFKEKDVQILYGVKKLRQKIVGDPFSGRKRKNAADTESETSVSEYSSHSSKKAVSLAELRRKQRKLAKTVLSNTTNVEDTLVSDTESLMSLASKTSEKSRKRVTLKFRPDAEEKFSEVVTKIAKSKPTDADEKDVLRHRTKIINYVARAKRTGGKKDTLTMTTILSIIRLSLYMIGYAHRIQLADLLRWIREGRLSMAKPDSFLPISDRLERQPFSHIQRVGIQNDFRSTIKWLGIEDIKTPNLYELVERYCKELHLPEEFLKKVHSIMLVHPPTMKFRNSNRSGFPDYECRAICYIVFVAKLLFGLNDYSEYKYSELATSVNKYHDENDIKKPKLFSWREWTRYIECRKAVLSKFSTVQNEKYCDNRLCNEYNFEDYYNRARSTFGSELCVMDEVLIKSMSKVRKSAKKEINHEEFPISVTPNIDETTHILNTLSHKVPKSTVKILSRDFSSDSIFYLMDGNRCKQTCLDCGFQLEMVDELSMRRREPKKPPLIPSYDERSRAKVAHKNLSVLLTETESPNILNEVSEFKFESEKISSNSLNQFIIAENSLIKKTFPNCKYWFFHEKGFRLMECWEFQEILDLFPRSFLWLLKECSNIVEINERDLYFDLVNIEVNLFKKFVEKKYIVWRANVKNW